MKHALTTVTDPALARYVAGALKRTREWLRDEHWRAPPAGARELEDLYRTIADSDGQTGPTSADLDDLAHGGRMAPRLMTYEDAAAVLAVSERTVRRLVADGTLPVVTVAGSRRIRSQDLEDYLDALEPAGSAA